MRRAVFYILAMSLLMAIAFAGSYRASDDQGSDNIFFSGEIVGPDLVVTGAPYSAEGEIERITYLPDGNRIIHTDTQSVARDSQGRVRREMTITSVGPLEVKGPHAALITDPVLKRQIFLNMDTKVATIKPRSFFRLGPSTEDETKKNQEKTGAKPSDRRPQVDDAKTESLGTKVIEGLTVNGELNTWTIPAKKIGNEKPLKVSIENWYSPELQILVIRHRDDPRFGGQYNFTLKNIQRAEPKASLFKIPAGYKIIRER